MPSHLIFTTSLRGSGWFCRRHWSSGRLSNLLTVTSGSVMGRTPAGQPIPQPVPQSLNASVHACVKTCVPPKQWAWRGPGIRATSTWGGRHSGPVGTRRGVTLNKTVFFTRVLTAGWWQGTSLGYKCIDSEEASDQDLSGWAREWCWWVYFLEIPVKIRWGRV